MAAEPFRVGGQGVSRAALAPSDAPEKLGDHEQNDDAFHAAAYAIWEDIFGSSLTPNGEAIGRWARIIGGCVEVVE